MFMTLDRVRRFVYIFKKHLLAFLIAPAIAEHILNYYLALMVSLDLCQPAARSLVGLVDRINFKLGSDTDCIY
jgi:hypothetical protein